jgi:hypothetical protein
MRRIQVAWTAIGIGLAAILVVRPPTTGDRLGLKRFVSPEMNSDWRVGQRFTMNASGLNAIEVAPVAVGVVTGRYQWRLREVPYGPERMGEVAASELVRTSSYIFTFAPVVDSRGRQFELTIAPAEREPGRGVALRATKGQRLKGGGLLINDALRWGSLAFRTQTSAVTNVRALTSTSDRDRPPRWLALPGLFGGWVAIGFLLRGAWVRGSPAD